MEPDRVLRIFLSSTFRDMFEEREELVRRAFPTIRLLCESRGVTCVEVDLRWGITDEESTKGLALPICLREIRRSHVVVGLLGERYGTLAGRLPPGLVERDPWIAELERTDRSITEWELLYGVLEVPGQLDNAYFYFRDPAYARPREGYLEADPNGAVRLRDLKDRIRRGGYRVHEDYADPIAAMRLILDDLESWVERHYPASEIPGPEDRERAAHRRFSDLRRRYFQGRLDLLGRLDRHASGKGPPMVLEGGTGMGKSALLAHWVEARRTAEAPARNSWMARRVDRSPTIAHFVAASPEAASWSRLLRGVGAEVARSVGVSGDLPDDDDSLPSDFANLLQMAAKAGRVVVVLDGLDQLDDRDGATGLEWLPEQVPPNIRLIVSTSGGSTLEALRRRGWPTESVGPLDPSSRKEMVESYFGVFGKHLEVDRIDRLVTAGQAANPLFLKTAAEQLRIIGDREKALEAEFRAILESSSVEALYHLALDRWEKDHERGCRGLVGEALRLIRASRFGLSETELLDLLGPRLGGPPEDPLGQIHWSPLAASIGESLVDRSGLLSPANEAFGSAIGRKYIADPAEELRAHRTLADYFADRPWSPRKADELPWHLEKLGAWDELAKVLADPAGLRIAWDTRPFELRSRWVALEASSPFRMVEVYRPWIESGASRMATAWPVVLLLNEAGHHAEALALGERVVKWAEATGDRDRLRGGLNALAMVARSMGRLDKALDLLVRHEVLCREARDPSSLAANLIDRGVIHFDRDEVDRAGGLYREAEMICRSSGLWRLLGAAVGNLGLVARRRGDGRTALRLLAEQEKICRRLNDLGALHRCLTNQAIARLDSGHHRAALKLYAEAEELCRRLGDRDALRDCFSNQAMACTAAGDFDRAIDLLKRKEAFSRERADRLGMAEAIAEQGWIIGSKLGLSGPALRRLVEASEIAEELDHEPLRRKVADLTRQVRQPRRS